MGEVNVTVNGRLYPIGCDDGEESQVERLSGLVDGRVRELAALVGQVGDARLLLMAALTMADDLEVAQRDLADLRQEIAALREAQTSDKTDADALLGLAQKLESIAAKLETP